MHCEQLQINERLKCNSKNCFRHDSWNKVVELHKFLNSITFSTKFLCQVVTRVVYVEYSKSNQKSNFQVGANIAKLNSETRKSISEVWLGNNLIFRLTFIPLGIWMLVVHKSLLNVIITTNLKSNLGMYSELSTFFRTF